MIHTDGIPTIVSDGGRKVAQEAIDRQDRIAREAGDLLRESADREARARRLNGRKGDR